MSEPQESQGSATAAPPERAAQSASAGPGSLARVLDVPVRVSVEIGAARVLVREVVQFGAGSVIELDRAAGEPADILVNGRLLARGELTTLDDRLAVRVLEVVDAALQRPEG